MPLEAANTSPMSARLHSYFPCSCQLCLMSTCTLHALWKSQAAGILRGTSNRYQGLKLHHAVLRNRPKFFLLSLQRSFSSIERSTCVSGSHAASALATASASARFSALQPDVDNEDSNGLVLGGADSSDRSNRDKIAARQEQVCVYTSVPSTHYVQASACYLCWCDVHAFHSSISQPSAVLPVHPHPRIPCLRAPSHSPLCHPCINLSNVHAHTSHASVPHLTIFLPESSSV